MAARSRTATRRAMAHPPPARHRRGLATRAAGYGGQHAGAAAAARSRRARACGRASPPSPWLLAARPGRRWVRQLAADHCAASRARPTRAWSTSSRRWATSTATAEGTGMVLTADGEILTNNHVVAGATSIKVRDIGNGRTYTRNGRRVQRQQRRRGAEAGRRLGPEHGHDRRLMPRRRRPEGGRARQRRGQGRHAVGRDRHSHRHSAPRSPRRTRATGVARAPDRHDPDERGHRARRLRRPAAQLRRARSSAWTRPRRSSNSGGFGTTAALTRPRSRSRSTGRCRSLTRSRRARRRAPCTSARPHSSASRSPRPRPVAASARRAAASPIAGVVEGTAAASAGIGGRRHDPVGRRSPDHLGFGPAEGHRGLPPR